jgi:hypothetical protein
MKSMLDSENIEYEVKDIEEYRDEYDEFIKLVDDNEFVPAFLCVYIDDDKISRHLVMAPDRDFQELEEALEKVKNFING